MKIESLTESNKGQVSCVSATVKWEENDRLPFELYFKTEGLVASGMECDPHTYLVACLIPAMHFGEKRILIEEEICPELLNGLDANMQWFQHWSSGQLQPVQIECTRSRIDLSTRPGRHAGSFLSGGVDSLATLRTNRLDFPRGHRASIRDCVMVHGFDIGGTTRSGDEEAHFDRSLAALREIARDAEVNLVPITTNVRLLHDPVRFWIRYFCGAALASVAHSLSHRLNRMYVGSSFNIPTPVGTGSHPLVDPNYSSHALQIRHDALNLTRLEKVRRVADWDVALRNLRVCTMNPTTELNCGTCEKCVRTMLELLAVGRLEGAEAFPERQIAPSILGTIRIRTDWQAAWYRELLAPLAAGGHQAIAERIQAKLADYERHRAWEREEDWKGAVKRFDRKFLGGGLFRSWQALRPRLLQMSGKGAAH